MIIAIDFDGTIVDHEFPKIGRLRDFAKYTINKLYETGHTIIIWTCRNKKETPKEYQDMIDFLLTNGIRFHYINQNDPSNRFLPEPKIYADCYIDDKNFGGFPGWACIHNYFFGE
jgi:hydroxymethylpyrimidine pyrophosphatase-like HAD family hydrolase